jgi:O-antigen ligase
MSRPASHKSIASNDPATVDDAGGPRWMLAWLTALLVARWLLPTEAAAEGLTLWLTQLVLATAVGRAAWGWRIGERAFRLDAVDGAMALWVGAQVFSALTVVFGVGDARAAINVAWEWIGSGVLIWLFRRELRTFGDVKSLGLTLTLTTGVLAGYGLWQHFVWYDQMTREYERLTSEYDQLMETQSEERRRIALQAEMFRQGIPLQPEARRLLEQRLKASREPFGLFALANTFAGLLAVMTLVGLGLVRWPVNVWSWMRMLMPRLAVGACGFCLVLTKSRTAWVGLFCGLIWWGLHQMTNGRETPSAVAAARKRTRMLFWLVASCGLIGVAFAAAIASGGLDHAVLAEAPKSLRYRWEYWQGSWETIREHFWLGTGPGNFRDHYLAHKRPESSEEIADPHNFVLDVWANAGVVGLLALLACVVLMFRPPLLRGVFNGQVVESNETTPTESASWACGVNFGAGLAFPLAALGNEFVGHGLDSRLWWLGGIWWLLWLVTVVLRSRDSSPRDSSPDAGSGAAGESNEADVRLVMAWEAAQVALLVHLCGAGGIAMPAITQLWLLIWIARETLTAARASCLSVPTAAVPSEKSASKLWKWSVFHTFVDVRAWLVMLVVLTLGCVWSATFPELTCRTLLLAGDFEWQRERFEAAQARYREAAEADPWSIEPLERLAESSLQHAVQTQNAADFQSAIQSQQQLVARLPFASRAHRRLGHIWRQWFEQSRDERHARFAAEALQRAVERYPHHAELLSEWALACESAGLQDNARHAARRALRQDDLNRAYGHSDKYLDDVLRTRMQTLASGGGASHDAN